MAEEKPAMGDLAWMGVGGMGETFDMHRALVAKALVRARRLLVPVPGETAAQAWRRQARAGFWTDTAVLHLKAAGYDGPRCPPEWGKGVDEFYRHLVSRGCMTVNEARQ